MKPINVIANSCLYKWVDTIVLDDDSTRAVAVLIHQKTGKVTTTCLCELTVIDKDIIKSRSCTTIL